MIYKIQEMRTVSFLALFLVLLSIYGCSATEKVIQRAITQSANAKIEKTIGGKSIATYNSGALVKSNGKSEVLKLISEYCSSGNYKILNETMKVTGEKKHTHTIIFECVN